MRLHSGRVEAAARTLVLLEALNRRSVSSIQMLHEVTGLPKATIVRLMHTLCDMGYAANDRRQGGYTVSSRVISLSAGFCGVPLIVEALRQEATAFTKMYHWPLSLAVLDGSSMVVRFTTTPDSPLAPLQSMINRRLSLIGRAMGRAYLAFCTPEDRSILLDALSKSSDPEDNCMTERRSFEALLHDIRSQGYAQRHPHIDPKSNTLAVPILKEKRVLATLGMTFFSSAVGQSERQERFAPILKKLAKEVAANISTLEIPLCPG
jgi:IclR family mhp operon transcriptional activator